MSEKKAWGKSEEAKNAQALFICMAHNLMLLLEDQLEIDGVENEKDKRRREERMKNMLKKTKVLDVKVSSMVKKIQRITQRPFKFFRWLRAYLFEESSWADAVKALKASYVKFA